MSSGRGKALLQHDLVVCKSLLATVTSLRSHFSESTLFIEERIDQTIRRSVLSIEKIGCLPREIRCWKDGQLLQNPTRFAKYVEAVGIILSGNFTDYL